MNEGLAKELIEPFESTVLEKETFYSRIPDLQDDNWTLIVCRTREKSP